MPVSHFLYNTVFIYMALKGTFVEVYNSKLQKFQITVKIIAKQ